ncbi:MAG: YoaK family protein [Stagnimonas sp.]|nr:YoaK family protein [Stagnimonas sp.]
MPQRRLDRWLFVGGPLLALVGGYVNVILLLRFAMPVSHVTGAVAHLGMDGVHQHGESLRLAASMVLAFLLGAVMTGYWTEGQLFQHKRRYGLVFVLQGLLFGFAAYWLALDSRLAVPAAACGCGMQNAMASSYRGLNLRTTHMTGVVTDIGVLLGLRLRGQAIQSWRLGLLCLIFLGYLAGTLLGVLLADWLQALALYLAAGVCLFGGLGYLLLFARRRTASSVSIQAGDDQ